MDSWHSTAIHDWKLETTFHPNGDKEHSNVFGDTNLWRAEGVLGSGTYGDVSKEICISGATTQAVRAVKQISKRHIQLSNRELAALIKFSDPNVPEYRARFVQCLGWFDDRDHIYISMEYIKHGDLQSFINQGPCTESEAVLIISQVALALNFMHQNQFVHRDLKPLNILVCEPRPHWQVKLADFGICKDLGMNGTALRTLQVGTQGYMAPELFDEPDDKSEGYSLAVDIWSLGAVAYCLRTGKPPFGTTRQVLDYQGRRIRFPMEPLAASSAPCGIFITEAMARSAIDRLTMEEVLKHAWLSSSLGNGDRAAGNPVSATSTQPWQFQASNAWENTNMGTGSFPTNFNTSTRKIVPGEATVRPFEYGMNASAQNSAPIPSTTRTFGSDIRNELPISGERPQAERFDSGYQAYTPQVHMPRGFPVGGRKDVIEEYEKARRQKDREISQEAQWEMEQAKVTAAASRRRAKEREEAAEKEEQEYEEAEQQKDLEPEPKWWEAGRRRTRRRAKENQEAAKKEEQDRENAKQQEAFSQWEAEREKRAEKAATDFERRKKTRQEAAKRENQEREIGKQKEADDVSQWAAEAEKRAQEWAEKKKERDAARHQTEHDSKNRTTPRSKSVDKWLAEADLRAQKWAADKEARERARRQM